MSWNPGSGFAGGPPIAGDRERFETRGVKSPCLASLQRGGAVAVTAIVLGCIPACNRSSEEAPFLVGIARPPLDEAALRQVQASGANSFRRTLEWGMVRGAAGRLHLPEEFSAAARNGRRMGLEPVFVLGYGHRDFDRGGYPESAAALAAFGEFARFAVQALRPDVTHWELWNEWNRGTAMPAWAGRGSPEAYARFVERVAPGLRDRGAREQIWGGSMEGIGRADRWTERAVRAGLLRPLDGLSFHPYSYFLPVEERVPERGLISFVQELEETVAVEKAAEQIPLYVTELGWPTHEGPDGVSLAEQAKYTSRALFLLRANPRVRGVWIYTLLDRPGRATNLENHFGLLFPDGTPKPAWHAFRDTALLLRDVARCERLQFQGDDFSLAGVVLAGRDGKRRVAVWAIEPGEAWKIVLRWPPRAGAFHAGVRLRVVGSGGSADLPVASRDGQETCEFTVTDMPVVIDPVPAGVIVDRVELR